jgi:hypothetical protein
MNTENIEILKLEITKLSLEPNDTLVIKYNNETPVLSSKREEMFKNIHETAKKAFPNNQVIVLDNYLDLEVVKDNSKNKKCYNVTLEMIPVLKMSGIPVWENIHYKNVTDKKDADQFIKEKVIDSGLINQYYNYCKDIYGQEAINKQFCNIKEESSSLFFLRIEEIDKDKIGTFTKV